MKELYLRLGLGFNTNSYIRAIEPFLFHLKFRYLADLNKNKISYTLADQTSDRHVCSGPSRSPTSGCLSNH